MAISTGAALLGAAVISGGAAIYSSNKASSAASSAAEQQTQSVQQSNEMQMKFMEETRADIAAAVKQGIIDVDTGFNAAVSYLKSIQPNNINAIDEYVNLIRNPEQVMSRPGVQFQYNRGIEALQTGFSKTTGGGLSGNIVTAAQEYGQNFASTALNTELARLEPLVNIQTNVAANLADLSTQRGTTKAGLRVGGATGTGQATTPYVQSVASNIKDIGGIGASNSINQANIGNSAVSSITNNISDLATLYALRPSLFKS